MRQHVVGVDDVGLLAFRGELLREVATEEILQRLDAAFARRGDRARGGIDAEHGNALLPVILQEVAVVARELDTSELPSSLPLRDTRGDVRRRMLQQCVGER